MYGKKRLLTWSQLETSIAFGDTSFTVQDDIDWQVGESIVVASTSFDHT